jgi:hypothetical protein
MKRAPQNQAIASKKAIMIRMNMTASTTLAIRSTIFSVILDAEATSGAS